MTPAMIKTRIQVASFDEEESSSVVSRVSTLSGFPLANVILSKISNCKSFVPLPLSSAWIILVFVTFAVGSKYISKFVTKLPGENLVKIT